MKREPEFEDLENLSLPILQKNEKACFEENIKNVLFKRTYGIIWTGTLQSEHKRTEMGQSERRLLDLLDSIGQEHKVIWLQMCVPQAEGRQTWRQIRGHQGQTSVSQDRRPLPEALVWDHGAGPPRTMGVESLLGRTFGVGHLLELWRRPCHPTEPGGQNQRGLFWSFKSWCDLPH